MTIPAAAPDLFRISTWNVNSLNVRLPHVLDWLGRVQPDVLALQETKLEDHRFPHEALADLGYTAVISGQKAYNGVALLSRVPLTDVQVGVPGLDDPQRRVLAATAGNVRVVCLYVPNGEAPGTPKYTYKLEWLAAVREWLSGELARHPLLSVVGDFNVAPEDRDVHQPRQWEGKVLVSEPERAAFRALLDLGLHDAFRLHDQPDRTYSWWPYGRIGFPLNRGLRIDHVLVSESLARAARECWIDPGPRGLERPSDHAPVTAGFALDRA